MTIYPSTFQYKVLSAIGSVIGLLLVSIELFSVLSGSLLGLILTLLPGVLLLYMLLYVSPWEIRGVNRHYSTTTINLISGGKGMYYYSVKIKDRSMGLFIFGSGIQGSDDLYEYLIGRTFGTKLIEKLFHPHLGPSPSRGRKNIESCPLAT
jgi:hypothetical protein